MLITHGQAYEEAGQTAAKAILNPEDENLRKAAFEVFEVLFGRNQGFKAALTVVDKLNPQEKLKLYKMLITHGQAYEEAGQTAAEAIVNPEDKNLCEAAFEIFEVLFGRNQGFEAALEVVDKLNPQEKLKLYKMLATHGQAYEEAIPAAVKAILNPEDKNLREAAFEVFEALFGRNQGFEAALGIVDKLDPQEKLRLYQMLVTHGQAYNQASEEALKYLRNTRSETCKAAFRVVKGLLSQGELDFKIFLVIKDIFIVPYYYKRYDDDEFQLAEDILKKIFIMAGSSTLFAAFTHLFLRYLNEEDSAGSALGEKKNK